VVNCVGSTKIGDCVWCMLICTHPPFSRIEIASIHAVASAMTCVRPASTTRMNDIACHIELFIYVADRQWGRSPKHCKGIFSRSTETPPKPATPNPIFSVKNNCLHPLHGRRCNDHRPSFTDPVVLRSAGTHRADISSTSFSGRNCHISGIPSGQFPFRLESSAI